ncbi:GNAT family N-acetyltransferase [Clavibacter michiganensis]|nr:GNAT family N-acetyltransferase [Clavibacter michiganensis subsp. michiganensis]UGY88468.1 GNAT family N-acetyltransferase [Clavibacter michiganensis]MWJ05791.1 GNAT family N-acetyltransferase [Clavibacter michiganensis subsp. michiganensis]MWJ89322.1 GNAT family N-acetyltransferase [Clavibacter michiganensis subsp. michiganensis]OQJ64704.1 GNAT family N-acetyltransferase [Clavibacter michiganensis subsp. michiganensis]
MTGRYPRPMGPRLTVVREGALDVADHEGIAALLTLAFPDFAAGYAGARSWAGAQPELRILVHDGDELVAHAGIRRMFVSTGDGQGDPADDLLMGSTGMVAVHPERQGQGLGTLLADGIRGALARLAVPFGLLETGESTSGYYARHGWLPLDGRTGHYNGFTLLGAAGVVHQDHGWMILPVTAPADAFPAGDLHVNGQLV